MADPTQKVGAQSVGAVASLDTSGSPINTAAGSLLVMMLNRYATGTTITPSDNKGLSWALIAQMVLPLDANHLVGAWYAVTPSAQTGHTFTATPSANAYLALEVFEIAVPAPGATWTLDRNAIDDDGTLGTSHTSGLTATTTQAVEYLIGCGGSGLTTALSAVAGSGWTKQSEVNGSGSTINLVTAYREVAATGTYQFDWTSISGTDAVNLVATFYATGGGGGGSVIPDGNYTSGV